MEYIKLPSTLTEFRNYETSLATDWAGRERYVIRGTLHTSAPVGRTCPCCGGKMHIHDTQNVALRHLPFGRRLSVICFERYRYRCSSCNHTQMQPIPFKVENHRMTKDLFEYTQELLSGGLTIKAVCEITGLGKNTVKDIDTQRLQTRYTVMTDDGQRCLIQPERQARILGVDEFKLHNGHKYATVIVDLETGHILWLAHGKKKACVYSFIAHVGMAWMEGVEAIACDMNSDFQEAFEDSCPHIQTVFDHFHIVKNFNDKVIGAVRKDEQRRLIADGNPDAASALKNTRYILTSSQNTLMRKDQEAAEGKVIDGGGILFTKEQVTRKPGYLAKYKELIAQNELLFTLDMIKEKLAVSYTLTDEAKMAMTISEIMDLCEATQNTHLLWFRRMLSNHFEGIIAHATYRISTGKVEGINNKIKTVRRQGYGYPDDEYFFLKLFDASRRHMCPSGISHNICD